jgi:F-type H+-transporting ATPase subunit delta
VAERIDPAARVYAEALFEAAENAGRTREVDRDLQALAEAVASNLALARAVLNPKFPLESKKRVITGLLAGADPLLRNAILLMADNGRLAVLHDMGLAYGEMAAIDDQILDVELTTAVPLEAAEVETLERRIAEATGMTARVSASVDERLIGGLVVRSRGVLVDASLRRRLEDLHRALARVPLAPSTAA